MKLAMQLQGNGEPAMSYARNRARFDHDYTTPDNELAWSNPTPGTSQETEWPTGASLLSCQHARGNAAAMDGLRRQGLASAQAPSPGGRLPFGAEMARLFGEDFSDVEVELGGLPGHAPAEAVATARPDAVSFATSNPDREEVAHELAHVVQHRRQPASGQAPAGTVGEEGSAAEREANQVAARAAAGSPVQVSQAAPADTLCKRDPPDTTNRTDMTGSVTDWQGPAATMVQDESGQLSEDELIHDASAAGVGLRTLMLYEHGDESKLGLVRKAKAAGLPVMLTLGMGASQWTATSGNYGDGGPGYLPNDHAEQKARCDAFLAWARTQLMALAVPTDGASAACFPDSVSIMNEPNLSGSDKTDPTGADNDNPARGFFNIKGRKGKSERKRLASLYAYIAKKGQQIVEECRAAFVANGGTLGNPDGTGLILGDIALNDTAVDFLERTIKSLRRRMDGAPMVADSFGVHPYLPKGEDGMQDGKRWLRQIARRLEDASDVLQGPDGGALRMSFTEYGRRIVPTQKKPAGHRLADTESVWEDVDEGDNLARHKAWESWLQAFASNHGVKGFVCYGVGGADVSSGDLTANPLDDPARRNGEVNPLGDAFVADAAQAA